MTASEIGRRGGIGMVTVLVAFLAVGCLGRSPSPEHFMLGTADPVERGDAAPDVSMLVGPVRLPAYLDRPQFARLEGRGEVELDEFARWLGGFEENLLRALALELAERTGSIKITTHPSKAPFSFDARLRLHVDDMVVVGDALRVRIRWALLRTGEEKPPVLAVLDERIPLEGRGNAAIVAAHDRAIERLAAAVTLALTE